MILTVHLVLEDSISIRLTLPYVLHIFQQELWQQARMVVHSMITVQRLCSHYVQDFMKLN